MARFVAVTFACLCAVLGVASVEAHGTSIPMRRHPATFTAMPPQQAAARVATARQHWRSAGTVVPMSGGYVTQGALFVELEVGTGAGKQRFNALVDTGSSNTAVPAVGCTTCGTQVLYNASASPTAVPLPCGSPQCRNCVPGAPGTTAVPAQTGECPYGGPYCQGGQCGFGITYGGGGTATQGTTAVDKVCFAGTGVCGKQVYVNQITRQLPASTQPAGILGLAFPAQACNPTCQPTILDSLVAEGQTADLYGMCLTKRSGGVLDLGFVDSTKFSGPLTYTRLVAPHWFNVEVKAITVAGVALNVAPFQYSITNDVIGSFVDSGTSILIISPYAFQEMAAVFQTRYPALQGAAALFGGSCANVSSAAAAQYPPVGITLAGLPGQPDFDLVVKPEDYLLPGGPGEVCLGIAGVPSIGAILGDVVMQSYYISFDRKNRLIGFAPIKACA